MWKFVYSLNYFWYLPVVIFTCIFQFPNPANRFHIPSLCCSYNYGEKRIYIYIYIKVKWSRYWPGVAQRVGRGIALLFHGLGTRRGWVASSTPRPHFTPGKDPVPILQEAGWAPGPVWMGGKPRPHRDSIPDRPARSSVAIPTELPGPHTHTHTHTYIYIYIYIYISIGTMNLIVAPCSS